MAASKVVWSLPGLDSRPEAAGQGQSGARYQVRMRRHPPRGLPGPHTAHSRSREDDDLLAKQPEAGFATNISVH